MENSSLNILSSIADNFCLQTITLQNSIMLREEQQSLPTPQELNMQTKMVANIIKIKKLIASDQVAIAMKKFLRFLSKEDKKLATTVTEQYMKFLGNNEHENPTETTTDIADNAAAAPQNNTPVIIQQEIQTTQLIERSTPVQEVLSPALEHIYGEAPPFTRADFEEFKYQLHNYDSGDANDITQFRDKRVNKRWFEYNLLQYTLPINKRQFLQDENRYHKVVNHKDTELHIRHYISKLFAAAQKENAA